MALAGILGAFGLSGAAGLNAYIPLLLVAVLGRLGVVHLGEPWTLLTQTWAIALLSVLLVIELVVDKVPGADHINDVVQTFIRPAAGAILFAANAGVITDAHPAIPLVLGLVVAFSVHATKAAARPVVNASTLGVGAPVVSVIEDFISVVASVAAIFAPLVVLGLVVAFTVVVFMVWSRRRQQKPAGAVVARG